MRGRRNTERPQHNPALPPCRVCGESGSGFHYGVTTCGACKGFFRRSLVRKEPYVCIQSHLCFVGPSTSRRQSCPKCRYDKCVSLGMSKEACKVGRYSLIKKSNDMREAIKHRTYDVSGRSPGDYIGHIPSSPLEVKQSSTPTHFDSMVKGHSIDMSKDLGAGHDLQTHEMTGEFPHGGDMRWNTERYQGEDQSHSDDNITSPEHGSSNSYTFNEDSHVDSYDDSLSMSSCFLGMNNDENLPTDKPFMSDDFKTRESCETEPSYMVLETPPQMNTVNSWLDLTPSPATSMTPVGCSPNMDMCRSLTALSPASIDTIPYVHHPLDDPTHISSTGQSQCHRSSPDELNCAKFTNFTQQNQTGLHSNLPPHTMPTQHHSFHMDQQHLINDTHYPTLQYTPNYSPQNIKAETQSLDHLTGQDGINTCINYCDSRNLDNCFDIPNKVEGTTIDESLLAPALRQLSPAAAFDWADTTIIDTPPSQNTGCQAMYPKSQHSILDSFYIVPDTPQNEVVSENDERKKGSKRSNEDGDDSGISHKIPCYDQEPRSDQSMQLIPRKNSRLSPISKSLFQEQESKPLFLLLINPEMSHHAISLYDDFPFQCYEKESLASLLKHCYQINGMDKQHLLRDYRAIDKYDGRDVPTEGLDLVPVQHKNNNNNSSLAMEFSVPELSEVSTELRYDMGEMDVIFAHLMAVHKRYIGNKASLMSESDIKGAQDTFWALCQLQDKVHGQMSFIDNDTYFQIFETTGIDVDKRKGFIMSYIYAFDGYLTRLIKFFRSVPGFSDFSLADKITLTKSCMISYNILTSHRGFDTNKFIIIDEEKKTACRVDVMNRLFPHVLDVQDKIMDVCEKMKSLKLSYEEIIVLKALVITTADHHDNLENPELVSKTHNSYVTCLLNLTRQRLGAAGDERFVKIYNMFQTMKSMRQELNVRYQHVGRDVVRLIEKDGFKLIKETFFFEDNTIGKLK